MMINSIRIIGTSGAEGATQFRETLCKLERNVFHLMNLYCTGTLNELDLTFCDITGETENNVQPLLLHLRWLLLYRCEYSDLFARMLSAWSPKLVELHFAEEDYIGHRHMMHFDDILRHSFPELVVISIKSIHNLNNVDIEEFLKRNPQLRKFGLVNCRNVDGRFFQSIVTHVPDIEAIEIDRVSKINDINLKYIGQSNCLNTLKLCTMSFTGRSNPVDNTFIPSILYEIHVANIPLRNLHVRTGGGNEEFRGTEQLIDAITKLKTLTTLWLFFIPNLKVSHLIGICKQLPELSELDVRRNFIMMTADDLLQIIKYAPKLQSLHHFEFYRFFLREEFRHYFEPNERKKWIDAYMKMVEIVGQRPERIRLLIALTDKSPMNANLPEELTRKFKDVLALVPCETSANSPDFFLEAFVHEILFRFIYSLIR